MLIGLISDTHIPEVARKIPDQIKEVFKNVDLILHAGDLYTAWVLDELEQFAPILAARGDDEYPDTANDKRIKDKHVLTIEGVSIWLKHIIWSWPDETQEHVYPTNVQKERLPNVIVFGHSHKAILENHGSILRVNPGSPTFPSYKHELGTVGLLKVHSGKAEAQIIKLR